MEKRIPLLLCLFLFPILAWGQSTQYTITGTVVHSQTGEPLAGANIQFQDLVIGTSADSEGDFTLTTSLEPGEYTLNVTFIGFKRNQLPLTLGNETEVDLGQITLQEDIIGTEELVITGASALTSKKRFGNSISTVNAEELESTGATQIDQALAGKIAGAYIQQNSGNPAGGISVRLRGTSTFLGQASPLYIVDGVIVNNDSPELIDVGGTATNRLVDLNPQDIARIEVVKGAAAAALYGSRANNGVVQIFTKQGQAGRTNITFSSEVNIAQIRKTLDVNMATNDQGEFIGNDGNPLPDEADDTPGRRYDLQDDIFRTAVGTNQYLSVSGGSGDTRYFMSGSYKDNEGIVDGSNFKRGTVRLNLDQTLSQWADISVNLNYSNSRSQEVPNGGLNSSYGALTGFIFGPNTFNPYPDPETGDYPGGALANPLEVIDKYDFQQDVNRIIGSAKLTLAPYDGLSIDHTLGLDTYSQVATAFIPANTTAPGLTSGFGRRSEREFLQMNNDLNIRYQNTLAGSLESTTLVGGTLQYENSQTIGLQAENFVLGVETVDGGADFAQPGESRSEIVIYGAFAQQTFGYKDRYFITGAGRFDASSVFGESERWQFFPKLSGSYVVSEEPFWQKSSLSNVINSFKLRASIGASGGQTAIGAFDRFNLFAPASVNGRKGVLPFTQRGALDVKPERQQELEIGFDASLFSDRIGVEFTWYDQHTDDLLLFRTIAPSTGYLSQLGNFGELDNTGIEFLVKAVPVNTRNVQWSSTVTFAANENEVSGVEGGTLIIPESFGQVAAINGEPLGVFYSDAFERDANGDIVYDENGLPVEASTDQIIGDPNPDWTGSFINDVSVGRNWNFRAQFDVSYGNDVFNFTERLGSLSAFGTLYTYEKELEGELPAGYNARVFGIFENWVEDGSYIKLRELSASYTFFPKSMGFRSLKLSLIGRNLFSIDSYNGYDPETNVGGQRTAVRGFDFVQVPIPRSIILGVTANF
ncbi:MAG: SusC/RagA family TonB-linked outer membrane protein [Balneolaceae bacterium]|nr:SusC/RagA family TonB-linked outer membrane protein [Balneolaceae bacterium]